MLVEFGIKQIFAEESGILGFGIQNTSQGIRNPTDDCNPKTIFHRPRIRNPQRRNPESFPYMGQLALGADPKDN